MVTGGTKGIGHAIIRKFAEAKFTIFTCARNAEDLKALQAEIQNDFPEASLHTFQADLSEKEQVTAFANFVQASAQPDVLVNNTGVFLPGAIHEEPEGNFELMMHTNLFSAYYLSRAFASEMKARRSGCIFSIGSIAGITAYPNGGSYAVSKWAMLGLTKCLRAELMPYDVKVTSILPGATYTSSWEGVELPVERFMKAEDVADAVWAAYALSPSSVIEEMIIRPQLGDL